MSKKKGWTIGKTRSLLYKTGRVLGDINSVKNGKIDQRVTNRVIGKASTRISSKVSRSILNFFR